MSVGRGTTGPIELRRLCMCALCFLESRWNDPPCRSCQDVSMPSSSSWGTSGCISWNMTDIRDFLRCRPGACDGEPVTHPQLSRGLVKKPKSPNFRILKGF